MSDHFFCIYRMESEKSIYFRLHYILLGEFLKKELLVDF